MEKKVILLLLALVSLGLLVSCSGEGCTGGEEEIIGATPPINDLTDTPTTTPTLTPTIEPTMVPPEIILLDSHLSLSGYGGKRIYGDQWSAQVFVPPEDWVIQSVRIRLWVEGTVGEVRVSIVEVKGGVFDSILGSQVVEPTDLVVGDPGSWVEVPLSSTVVAGLEYAVLVSMDGGDEFNTVRWIYDAGGSGGTYYSNNGGLDWYQALDRDFTFEIWGGRSDV